MKNFFASTKFKIAIVLSLGFVAWSFLPSEADKMRSKAFSLKNENQKLNIFDGFVEPDIPNNKDNDSSILGIDSNQNGVRDDVEIWINRTWGTYNERMALRQYAQDLQYSLVAAEKNTTDYIAHSMSMEYTTGLCFLFFWEFDKAEQIIDDLEVLTYNTKERKNILYNFDNHLYSYGTAVPGMSLGQNYKGCRFKIENEKNLMENYIKKLNKK